LNGRDSGNAFLVGSMGIAEITIRQTQEGISWLPARLRA
jgi:hypothetical protein